MDLLKKIISAPFILLVKIYQWTISPLLPNSCRHTPTCSQYTIEAIQIWGPLKGIWLGAKRLSKCHPWGTHGYDPVPQKHNKSK
ncbi:membrane protein insertion efficiency factor YidD [Owenweeksia hongkongensis]|uniref:membrane protein insertion efficiency factor YidD n=1 Tax=Owenweeksia hongkongensis TaxID=253245 RepID=UPI0009FEFB91|nr:membrane protein insertion efficiency factor YidD [Owenweeksia hongkongensis]